MRICLVSREYPNQNHGGGIGTYTEKTARALAQLGHRVDVITEASGTGPGTFLENGLLVHRLEQPKRRRLRTLARAQVVSSRISALRPAPDIVQACEFGAEAVLFALRRPSHAKLVTRLATPSFAVRDLNEGSRRGRSPSNWLVDELERQQTRRSDLVISISDALTGLVCDRWAIERSQVVLTKTGVDFAERQAPQATPLPDALVGLDYILYFGRLEERKGVHILAEALPELLRTYPDLHVVFAGAVERYRGRPMDAWIRQRNRATSDRLHFLPRQGQANLFSLLEHATVVVLPSLWEGLGNVALEAIDMGCAIVATSGSGFAEVLQDNISGLLVPPGDQAELGRALAAVVEDRQLRQRLSAGARERAGDFGLLNVTSELVAVYEDLLGRSGGR